MQFCTRVIFGAVAAVAAALALAVPTRSADAVTIEDRSAEVNGTRLHYLVAGIGEPVILLHGYAQNSHMWRPLIAELAKTHTVIAPDLRGFGRSAQAARAATTRRPWRRTSTRLPTSLGLRVSDRRSRHRADGRLCLRRPVSGRRRPHRADGCVPARRRRLDEGLAAARPVALPLLRQDAAGARRGSRTHLFRALLERFRRRSARIPSRKPTASSTRRPMRSRAPCGPASRCSAPSSRTPRILPSFAETKLTMPMLVLTGEKAGGAVPDRPGPAGRRQRRGRHHQGLRPLADRRGAGPGHPEAGGSSSRTEPGTTAWGRARFAFCPCPRLLPTPRPRARASALPNSRAAS